MQLLKNKLSKSLLVTTALLSSSLIPQTAFANQVDTPTAEALIATQDVSLVDTLTQEVNQETLELNQLKTRLKWLPEQATVEKMNLENKIKAKEQSLDNAQQKLSQEEARIAEEQRIAEEARKAEEARLTFTNNILTAQNSGVPVASSFTPNIQAYSNTYPWGQCTWGVSMMADWVGPYWGNANQWAASAASEGYAVGDAPVAGAIIVWLDGAYGHVGMVTDVDAQGNIQILESNYGGSAYYTDPRGIGNYRGWFNPTSTGIVKYIYPKV